jgi:sugar/nucleoside kinase (ribokinase family)
VTFELIVVGVISQDTNIQLPYFPSANSEAFVSSIDEVHGGAGANVAALASFYGGLRVGFVGMIGDDDIGPPLLTRMVEYGVDLRGVAISTTAPSTRIFTVIQPSGDRAYIVHLGAHSELSTARLPPAYCEPPAIWYLAPCSPETHRSFVHFLTERNLQVALNPGSVYKEQAPVSQLIELLAGVRILFVNDKEARVYSGEESLDDAARTLLGYGPHLVVLTRSDRGSIAYQTGCAVPLTQPSMPSTVVSDIGAGDAFAAGFLTEYIRTRDVAAALRLGSAFGAFSVTQTETREADPDPDAIKPFLAQ